MLSSKQSYGAYNFGENWFRVEKREIRSQTCVCDFFFFSNEMNGKSFLGVMDMVRDFYFMIDSLFTYT